MPPPSSNVIPFPRTARPRPQAPARPWALLRALVRAVRRRRVRDAAVGRLNDHLRRDIGLDALPAPPLPRDTILYR